MLVVIGDDKVGADLVRALQTEKQAVDTVIPEALPDDLAGLADYDSIVLADVPRLRLTDRAMAALQVYVRDLGRGLVMVGGERSFGAGGYTKTPIEETLPVDMGVKDREKQPDVALVVVIDKSGSMDACHCNSFNMGGGGGSGIGGVKKVDIGKEAIMRAAAALTSRDELGVVAFDESAHWVVKTSPLGGLADLQSAIAGITPNGQTNIFAGLDQAVQSLKDAKATRRHIILLTDGWSSSGQYGDILKQMKAAGITLSTVGAGGGSNPFLEDLAKQGGGRFYDAANPQSIPDIFLKETQQVAGQQIVEESFFPILTSNSPILRGIEGGYPELLGYNGTTAKPAAQTVFVTARDDPLLAQWQYGLGRSVAWTSDTTGKWAKDWLPWPSFTKFFSQMVGWTFPGEETGGIETTFETRGGRTYLRVESVSEDGSPRDFYVTHATVVGPDFEPADVTLPQIAPGVYETQLGELPSGAYAVRVTQTKPGTSPLGRTHRAGGADGRRVPPARVERAAAGGDPQRDARQGGREPGAGLDARPGDDEQLHGAVAVAAGPGVPALAAGHRTAARVDGPPGARRCASLDERDGARAARRGAAGRRRRPHGGARAGRLVRGAFGDPARRDGDRRRSAGRHHGGARCRRIGPSSRTCRASRARFAACSDAGSGGRTACSRIAGHEPRSTVGIAPHARQRRRRRHRRRRGPPRPHRPTETRSPVCARPRSAPAADDASATSRPTSFQFMSPAPVSVRRPRAGIAFWHHRGATPRRRHGAQGRPWRVPRVGPARATIPSCHPRRRAGRDGRPSRRVGCRAPERRGRRSG